MDSIQLQQSMICRKISLIYRWCSSSLTLFAALCGACSSAALCSTTLCTLCTARSCTLSCRFCTTRFAGCLHSWLGTPWFRSRGTFAFCRNWRLTRSILWQLGPNYISIEYNFGGLLISSISIIGNGNIAVHSNLFTWSFSSTCEFSFSLILSGSDMMERELCYHHRWGKTQFWNSIHMHSCIWCSIYDYEYRGSGISCKYDHINTL